MDLRKYRPGSGMMVSAAFIGPGTVTACTLAGANFGYALVWALAFATVTTIILQSFAVRIALTTKMGLAQAMMQSISTRFFKVLIALILLTALVLGNAAYEAGNISGAVLGIQAIGGSSLEDSRTILVLVIVLLAGALIMLGNPEWLTKILICLVLFMSLAFVLTFILTKPDFVAVLWGLKPQIPDGGLLTAIALIGTTIVPYNLFLHAATAKDHWKDESRLSEAQTDSLVSIGIGGLVSITILATAAGAMFGGEVEINNAVDMAKQISPLFGNLAAFTLGAGLFAAGLTSAITAPLATGYILQEILGREQNSQYLNTFRITALLVLLVGGIVASLSYNPVEIILVAQIANGLLLPIVTLFLLRIANNKDLLGTHANGMLANLAGVIILLVTTMLGARLILRALGYWP